MMNKINIRKAFMVTVFIGITLSCAPVQAKVGATVSGVVAKGVSKSVKAVLKLVRMSAAAGIFIHGSAFAAVAYTCDNASKILVLRDGTPCFSIGEALVCRILKRFRSFIDVEPQELQNRIDVCRVPGMVVGSALAVVGFTWFLSELFGGKKAIKINLSNYTTDNHKNLDGLEG